VGPGPGPENWTGYPVLLNPTIEGEMLETQKGLVSSSLDPDRSIEIEYVCACVCEKERGSMWKKTVLMEEREK